MTDASFCIPRKAVDKLLKARADVRTIIAYLILARFTDESGEFTTAAGHSLMKYAVIRHAKHKELFTRLLKSGLIQKKAAWQKANPDRVWPDQHGKYPATYAVNTFGEPLSKRVWIAANQVDGIGDHKPLKELKNNGTRTDDRAARLLLILYATLRMDDYGGANPTVISLRYSSVGEHMAGNYRVLTYAKQKAYVSPELQRIYPTAWRKAPTAKDQKKAAVLYAQVGGRPELGEGFAFIERDWSTVEFANQKAADWSKKGEPTELGTSHPVRRAVYAAMARLLDCGLVLEVVTGFFGQDVEPRALPVDCSTVQLEVINRHGDPNNAMAQAYRQTAAELLPGSAATETYTLIVKRGEAVTLAGTFRPRYIPYNSKNKGVRDWQTRIGHDNSRAMGELNNARKAHGLELLPVPGAKPKSVRQLTSRPQTAALKATPELKARFKKWLQENPETDDFRLVPSAYRYPGSEADFDRFRKEIEAARQPATPKAILPAATPKRREQLAEYLEKHFPNIDAVSKVPTELRYSGYTKDYEQFDKALAERWWAAEKARNKPKP